MPKKTLTNDSEFIVGEEKALVYFLAIAFLGLFLYGLIDMIVRRFSNISYLDFVFIVALLPALLFWRKGRSNHIYIRVNKKGIYQDEKLVTNWPNFLNAYIAQKEKTISIQDNFQLVVEHLKDGYTDGFRRKIPLTNTQNKSEEDVLAAIKFFWQENKTNNY